jgi:hypothetical protein
MLERLGQRGNVRGLVVGHFEKGVLKANASGPADESEPPGLDVGEFDGACWAKASACSTNSCGTGRGKNIRVEWRSIID